MKNNGIVSSNYIPLAIAVMIVAYNAITALLNEGELQQAEDHIY
ncbi:putative membrane protein [Brevibacillus laterosporus GI-9]|nr:putative membrane protein [Brevibacillus laterosporus GI-9]